MGKGYEKALQRERERERERERDLYFMHTRILDLIHNSGNANTNCTQVSH